MRIINLPLHSKNKSIIPVDRSDPWLKWAYGMWLFLALVVSVKTFISPEDHTVFPKFAARAINWWSGLPLYIEYEGLGRFPYSPTFAVSLTPFAVLGNRLGAILWSWMNIAVYIWGLQNLIRDILPGKWPPKRRGIFFMLAMVGAIRGIWNAQSNILIIGLIMGGTSAVIRKRWWMAAFLLTVPVYLKVWPIVIPLLILALRPRMFAWRFLVAMGVGALIPFLTQPFGIVLEQYFDWFRCLAEISPEVVKSYRDIWTVSNLLDYPIDIYAYRIIQLVTGIMVLGWVLWQQRCALSGRWLFSSTLAMGAAWMMIFGPAVEYNTYVVLAPMATWGLLTAFEERKWRGLTSVAYAMTMILGAGAVERALMNISPVALAMLPTGSLLFVIWLLLSLYGRRNICLEKTELDN